MPVMSVRLSDKEVKLIQALAQEEDKEKSSEARELMLDGIKYKMLLGYKQGKVSLGMLAKKLGMPLTDALDLLASLGIPAPISYDDYLQGLETARKLFSH
jgi:predicted HTH domain antitoxin